MEYVKLFVIRYFVLICLSAVLYLNSIQRYRQHPKINKCIILITSLNLVLSVANILEQYGKDNLDVWFTTFFAFVGYILRPICLYFFIIMSGIKFKKTIWYIISLIPLLINIIIFSLAFIPGMKDVVFGFELSQDGLYISFAGGPLRYTSHIISLGYLIFLLVIAVRSLKSKHLTHFLSILACALFVIAAVLIETFMNSNGEYFFLHTIIAVSALQYYLYLYIEKSQIDSLTGLYNRETYYLDLPKMEKVVTGVIQFDMDGLKYLNDNYGHVEGDKALSTIANAIMSIATRNMYVYRLGGDEFILLAVKTSEQEIVDATHKFRELLAPTGYHCSTGYMYRANKSVPVEELIRQAERYMYEEKARFYKNSPFERRKS